MADKLTLRLRLIVGTVSLTALAALAASWYRDPLVPSLAMLFLAAFAAVGEALSVDLPKGGSLSIDYPVQVAAILLLGPTTGAVVAGLSSIPVSLTVRERPLMRGLFNSSQLLLSALAAGWAYTALGGYPLAGRPLSLSGVLGLAVPVIALAATHFAINTGLVSLVVAISTRTPFRSVWVTNYSWTVPTQISLAVLGLALADLVAAEGFAGLFLFVVPLLIARQFYQRYGMLRGAYADTVRSLVAVIEAKDPYTRGHSERVAKYSVSIAREMGLRDREIERLELAALLHDLGKLGINRRILVKADTLDQEEYAAIMCHPEIGAHIVESVSFLSDIVPTIRSHHERQDGAGYGDGLSGGEIPPLARILAVADSFDAMTSSRPYRGALSLGEAIEELRANAGSQFDPAVVGAFLAILDEGLLAETHATAVEGGLADAPA